MKSILSISIMMIVMSAYLFAEKDVKIQESWSKYYSKDPNLTTCTKGDLLETQKQAILTMVNSIRALHNLKPVTYEPAFDAPASEAALMMAKNEELSHTPPNSWGCWSQTGYDGAEHTNLFMSTRTASDPPTTEYSIVSWMIDNFSDRVGHRRWIIDPFLKRIAIGRADGASSKQQGQAICGMALYVIDDSKQDVSDWQVNYVGYPYQYYSPQYVFYNDGGSTKWHYLSFTYVADKYNYWNNQKVDYSGATVTMTDENGNNVGISSAIYDTEGYGVPNCLKWMPTELNKEVKYTVKITGVKYGGQSSDFEYWFKLTDNVYSTPPAAISQISPGNNAKNVPVNTSISWMQNNNAIRYHLQISKNSDMSNPVINTQDINTYGYKPTQALENEVTYYWKVRGWNDAGFGAWSLVWSFKTGASAPDKPVLLTPADGELKAGLKPLLTWEAQSAAQSYDVIVAESSDFSGWSAVSENVASPKYQSLNGDFELDTKYFWKVRANNASGSSDWSNIWTFTTGTAIEANVTLLEPANAAKAISTTPLMKWKAVPNATGYDMQISEGDLFNGSSIKITKTKMSETEFQVTGNFLDPNVEYSWRVKAYIGDATGPWSAIWHFSTVKDANLVPALLTPLDSALNVALTQEFSWGPIEKATSYELQVALRDAFDGQYMRIDEVGLTSRFFSATTQLKDSTVYWWRVRAKVNNMTTYPWSYPRIFSTYDQFPHVSVMDKISSVEISVYPNPAVQNITFDLKLINSDNITIIVFDELGKILKTPYEGMLSAGSNRVNLNVSDLPSGNYNYCIYAGDGYKYGKFMVTK
ncbi:MAG: CAP domain-containing protein [bacterium]